MQAGAPEGRGIPDFWIFIDEWFVSSALAVVQNIFLIRETLMSFVAHDAESGTNKDMQLHASLHGFLAFGIPSGPDLIILLVIVLVLFGAKRLPELARGLGQSVNEFKRAKEEFDKEVAKTPEPPAAPPTPISEPAKEEKKPS